MSDHDWQPTPDLELSGNQLSDLIQQGKNERKPVHCSRCKTFMTLAALGHAPNRIDIHTDGTSSQIQRTITGWETNEQAMRRQKITEDCDVAVVAKIMES